MSFSNGDKSKMNLVLTSHGKNILATKGLQGLKIYYRLFDDDVIYTVNAFPTLMTDINGDANGRIFANSIMYRYNLK
jgi:hypothetical protein